MDRNRPVPVRWSMNHREPHDPNGDTDMSQEQLFPPESAEEILAADLGVDVEDFVDTFGAGWTRLDQPHDFDADPEPDLLDFPPWYVAGEPAQLMLRIHRGSFELAVPRGTWLGTHHLMLRPAESTTMPTENALTEQTLEHISRLVHKR